MGVPSLSANFMNNNPFTPEEKQSEFKLHMAIKKHYESCFIGSHNPDLKIMHIANEQRDSAQGHFNKMLGVQKGFSDILAGWPLNTGVCEVKLPGKQLTPDQNRFLSWARSIGWHTGIARTVAQFHQLAISWGLIPSHHRIIEPDYTTKEGKFARGFEVYAPSENHD